MDKKASTQVDWVISLAVFIIYLMIFFMFLRPRLDPITHYDSFPSIAKEGLLEDVYWSVFSVPLVINADSDELVIIDFPFNYSNFQLSSYHTLIDGKLFTVKDDSSYLKLVYSGSNYSKPFFSKKFTADNDSFVNNKLKVEFDDFMPSSLDYKDNNLITDFGFDDFGANDLRFYEDDLLSEYKASSSVISHSCFLADEFSRLYCFVDSDETNVDSINFSFTIDLIPDFDSWDTLVESFDFVDGCETKNNITFINFDGSYDVALILDRGADVEFCYSNVSLDVEVSFDDVSDFSYTIIAHENEDIDLDPYSVDFGMITESKGISLEKLDNLSNSNYDYLKTKWDFPLDNDFNFDVFNVSYDNISNKTVTNMIFSYNESSPSDYHNVYASTFNDFILDNFNNLNPVNVVVRAW